MGSLRDGPAGLTIAAPHWAEMLSQVRASAPLEACGLVGGLDQRSLRVFPMENIEDSPVRYRMDPREQLRVFKILDEMGWDLLALRSPTWPKPPTRKRYT